jgi:hypothetical protein
LLPAFRELSENGGGNAIAFDYQRLHDRWFEDESQQRLEEVQKRALEVSEIAVSEAPYKRALIDKWTKFVYSRYEGNSV